jgi:hypothetical protein
MGEACLYQSIAELIENIAVLHKQFAEKERFVISAI